MSDHIEEIAFLSSLLTQIAARIEALKLRNGIEALAAEATTLKQEVNQLRQELQKQEDDEVKE